MLVAGTVLWVLNARWFPVVSAAVEHLPETGAIHAGRLECGGEPVQPLAESRFIAFAIDLEHAGQARSPSQIQIEFGQSNLRIYSVFGLAEIRYPVSLAVPFNFQELKPWWGAWAPVVLAIAALGTILALLLSWKVLATVYCLPVWLLGFILNRDLTWRGSWLLSGAALMPGALVMAAAIAGYGLGKLDFWDLNKDVEMPVYRYDVGKKALNKLAWSADGKRIATGDIAGKVTVFNVEKEV